ncbi:MAG: 30S ribosome-binding factor RbfA [Candidatus Eisenbacteria bacterium]|nr:30S ribosome-binding factor RbfA [Candidatus Eisenbacteria bacterium]
MTQIRVARLREEILQQVSDILQNHLSDPRLSWVSVARVDLSPDLRHAKIYISVLGSDEAQQESLRVLSRAAGAVRSELARRLRLRRIPEILFRADHSIQYSVRVLALLRELGFAGDEPPPSAEDEP